MGVNNGCGREGVDMMLRNMGINLRGGDFGSIFAIPAKKNEYGAKKYLGITV